MSLAKTVLIGGIGAGLALWFLHSKTAGAAAAGAPPPAVGPGATVTMNPAGVAGIPFPIKATTWPAAADASGQQAGHYVLLQNANNPLDWTYGFQQTSTGGAGIIGSGTTQNSGLLAQASAAGLLQ